MRGLKTRSGRRTCSSLAALLAGRGVGLWADAAKLERVRQRDRVFKPRMKPEVREELYAGWRRAVAGVRAMAS